MGDVEQHPRDLAWIRHRLDSLVAGRLAGDHAPEEAALYHRLCALEVELLGEPAE